MFLGFLSHQDPAKQLQFSLFTEDNSDISTIFSIQTLNKHVIQAG